jgi:hypothetical protein
MFYYIEVHLLDYYTQLKIPETYDSTSSYVSVLKQSCDEIWQST